MPGRIAQLWFISTCLLFAHAGAANPVRSDHIEVELISEVESIQAGQPFWAALRLAPDEHWHIYWRNPGDTGLPPSIEWELPEGSGAGDIHWPYPQEIRYRDVVDYGYERETLLPVLIQPPPTWDTATPFTLTASASWLVCSDTCIPGRADLRLELPVGDSPPALDQRWESAFSATRKRLPAATEDWRASFALHQDTLYLRVETPQAVFDGAEEIRFFPYAQELIAYGMPQETRRQPSRLDLRQAQHKLLEKAPDAVAGVFVIKTAAATRAYAVTAAPTLIAEPALFDETSAPLAAPASASLLLAALSATLGGILLNLMPCVFPVLSFKALGVIECTQLSRNAQRLHGVAYTLGVMIFFAIIAAILLLLRASGAHIGWGFQLQSPWFVALMAYLLFVMGLGFSGVLEIGAGLMGVGDKLTGGSGLSGSFFTGALAAVVASPCTAPFMGTAVAFAISQPPASAVLVFLALGFGMALPFLLISFIPGVANMLPRPGPWMTIFRQALAFPLYITSVWLLWVLGRQTDASGMASVLGGMILLAFAIWVWKLRGQSKGRWRRWTAVATVLATLGAFGILHLPFLNVPILNVETAAAESKVAWEPYSATRLAELRAAQKPVFVNMTADWCITCIANERVALSFPTVQQAFKDEQIARLKGDWTSHNPEITAVLRQFGREGVPLYVLYAPQPDIQPIVLPQILTPSVVLNAFSAVLGGESETGQENTVEIFDPMTGTVHTLDLPAE